MAASHAKLTTALNAGLNKLFAAEYAGQAAAALARDIEADIISTLSTYNADTGSWSSSADTSMPTEFPLNNRTMAEPRPKFKPAKGFNPQQTGFITFNMDAYEDGLLDGVLITPPSEEFITARCTALATDPQMRVLNIDEEIPSYDIQWIDFVRTFTEI
jgi:hypothetical protein